VTSSARSAVFLDRDGTINVERDYLSDPEQLELIPGAGPAIHALNDAGLPVIVVTNQSGIARGMLDTARLDRITARLDELLAAEGASVLATYHCPHHPEYAERLDCECRKPRPGMLLRAAREHGLDLERSWIVGDSLRDLSAGEAVGARGILVETGKGAVQSAAARKGGDAPACVVADLAAAVQRILADS